VAGRRTSVLVVVLGLAALLRRLRFRFGFRFGHGVGVGLCADGRESDGLTVGVVELFTLVGLWCVAPGVFVTFTMPAGSMTTASKSPA